MSDGKIITAGDRSVYPFNHTFTEQERRVLQIIAQLRTSMITLKRELAQTPHHACAPPENYDPRKMEEIQTIEESIDSLDLQLRWIPGGAYRYAPEERT
jgi:hypothetical protein